MATCVVVLDKEKTPFYSFGKDPIPIATLLLKSLN